MVISQSLGAPETILHQLQLVHVGSAQEVVPWLSASRSRDSLIWGLLWPQNFPFRQQKLVEHVGNSVQQGPDSKELVPPG